MKLRKTLSLLTVMLVIFSFVGITAMAEGTGVAKIGDTYYTTFDEALTAASSMTSDVTVSIYGEVEFINGMELNGSYNSITFVGETEGAKITINQSAGGDYLEAHGKTVAFINLTLAKANPAWSGNSGHMGNYFSVQGGTVTYTDCIFPNGACTNTGTATYTNCTFQNTSEYGLWVYDDALVTVNGGTINSKKGIKVYSEGEDSVTSTLTVQNATFTANVTAKPAVAIGYAESITLIGNTYNNTTGVLELDSGSDADCEGVTFVAKDANGNDIASKLTAVDRSNNNAPCGVLVDGKIYTTVAQAAEVATAGSTVTLLHDSTETVELPKGVTLNTNGFTAENVTEKVSAVAHIGEQGYESVQAAINAANEGDIVTIKEGTYSVPSMKAGITVVGEGNVLLEGTLSGTLENLTMKNLHIKGGNAQRWAYAKGDCVFENVTFEATSVYALHFDGITEDATLLYKNCTIIGWAAMGGSPASCVFDGCTIKGNGAYGVIRTYFATDIKNCKFDVANVNTTDVYQDGIHAVGAKVKVNDCQNLNGNMKDILNISKEAYIYIDDELVLAHAAKVGDNYYTTLADALAAAQSGDVTIELLADVELAYPARQKYGTAETTSITINGNGNTLTLNQTDSDWSSIGMANSGGVFKLNNLKVAKSGYGVTGGSWNTHAIIFNSNVEFTDVDFAHAISVQGESAKLTDINITENGGYYGLWISADCKNVEFKGGSITATNGGRGIKIADEYVDVPNKVNLTVENVTFKTAKKAAILVSSTAGASITATNCDITNVAEDSKNIAWVDEDWGAAFNKVTVNGTPAVLEGGAPELPTATVTELDNSELTFAMTFTADDVTEKQLEYYGDWYADFELTVNKEVTFNANGGADGYLSGQYDALSENWVNVPFENVTVSADQPLKIMEYAAELMGQPGLKYTYAEVYEFVKEFNCGVLFTEEFLAANPDLQVTLELRMYNPNDESESYVIGETYVFESPEVEEEETLDTKTSYVRNIVTKNENNEERYQVILFAGIDSLKYASVGYEITVRGTTREQSTKTVYESYTAAGVKYTPSDWGENCNYIFALPINFKPELKNESVTYRPFAVTLDGKKIWGPEKTIDKIYNK